MQIMWDDDKTLLANNQSSSNTPEKQQPEVKNVTSSFHHHHTQPHDSIERQVVHFENLKRLLLFLEDDTGGAAAESTKTRINELLTKKNVSTVVDLMKSNKNDEKFTDDESVLEECCWILYYESIHNPSFKKGVARLFQALEEYPNHIAMHRAACAAIRNVVEANPEASERISPQSMSVLVIALQTHRDQTELVGVVLGVLALLHFPNPSLTGVAVQQILLAMKHHFMDASIQAIALRTLANTISYSSTNNSSSSSSSQPIDVRLLLRSMRQHAQDPYVQQYGCCALRHLSSTSSNNNGYSTPQIITGAGGMEVLLDAMKAHIDHPLVQEHALAALHHLLSAEQQQGESSAAAAAASSSSSKSISPPKPVITSARNRQQKTITTTDLVLSTVLMAMKRNEHSVQVQIQGLQVLSRDIRNEHYEWMLSEGGLDVILTAMTNFPLQVDTAKMGCVLLKNVSRTSMDYQRAITAKNGISVVLTAMRRHIQEDSKSHLEIQDAAFGCIRNLCAHQDNRRQLALEGGISTLAVTLTVFWKDAAIQAYGCDALGRLAKEPDLLLTIFEVENGIGVAMDAMTHHPDHAGVQDRACFLLYGLSEYHPALLSMTNEKGILPLLLKSKVPAKKEAVDRLHQLIKRVESVGKRGWFFGRPAATT
jgi:hypothetical protein